MALLSCHCKHSLKAICRQTNLPPNAGEPLSCENCETDQTELLMCCCCCCSCHRKIIDIWSLALPSSRIVPCGTYMQTFINSVAAFHTKYFVYLALRRRISLTSAQAVSSQSSAVSKEPNIRREVRWVCWVSCTLTECIYLLFGLPRTARPQLSGSRCTTMFGWTLFVVVGKVYKMETVSSVTVRMV